MRAASRAAVLLGVILILLSVVGVKTGSAAIGTVQLDKAQVTTPGGTVKITLTDADLNTGVLQVNESVDFDGNTNVIRAGGLPLFGTQLVFVQKSPIVDGPDANSILNRFDVTVSSTEPGLRVIGVDGVNGLVTLQNNTTTPNAIPAGIRFDLTYTAADEQTHTVKVVSTADAVGFDITLKETGAATGTFEGTFQTGATTVFQLQGAILESDIAVDLDGNATTSGTVTVNAGNPASEVNARIDLDGDGFTTGTADLLGVDLNGDGDALDTGVDAISVAGLPDSPTRPAIRADAGAIITVSYADANPAATRTDIVTVVAGPEPTPTPEPCCVGSVNLDKAQVTTPGGTVRITLTDADLNTGVLQVNESVDFDGNTNVILGGGLAPNATQLAFVQKFPILDGPDADSILNSFDVTVSSTAADIQALRVIGVDGVNGLVTLQNNTSTGNAVAAGTRFDLTYTAADVQTHTVKVTSTQDAVGFDITLKENGPSTATFEGTFQTGATTAFQLQGAILESDIGVDLDGNATTTGTVTVNAGNPVSEVNARIDVDGDGFTTGTKDVLGVDLNGDGDALDTGVGAINVAGLPDSPTRPAIATAAEAIITVSYADADPPATVSKAVSVVAGPDPTPTPIPVPSATLWALMALAGLLTGASCGIGGPRPVAALQPKGKSARGRVERHITRTFPPSQTLRSPMGGILGLAASVE